jgi:hypothetical protein
MPTHDHYSLALALSVVYSAQATKADQEIVLPGADYEGWTWLHTWVSDIRGVSHTHKIIFVYANGVLTNLDAPNDAHELTPTSVGELWSWEMLEVLSGNYCDLPLMDCPECGRPRYLGKDYICPECRTIKDEHASLLLRCQLS